MDCGHLGENMTEQTVTLAAAVVAAIAALVAAILAGRTARRVAQETAAADRSRELVAFNRERRAKMRDMLFENAIALNALERNCRGVPWLAKTSSEQIQERGNAATSRIEYASEVLGVREGLPLLSYHFTNFCGKVAGYKAQIDLGNIELSGHANEAAKQAETRLIEAGEDWQKHLNELREFVCPYLPRAVASMSVAPLVRVGRRPTRRCS